MTVVITMAGLGSRFKKVGYKVPKYQIEVNGKTLFEWSMISLSDFYDADFFFVVRAEDNSYDFIIENCNKLGIKAHVITINHMTSGQAETAYLCSDKWNKAEELLIYNIDTYVEAGCILKSQIRGDGFIPCFKAFGEHWSFVRLNENNQVVEIREKKRISDNCTIGAYYFKTASLYEQLYEEFYLKEGRLEAGERYIAPLYNYLLEKQGTIYISDIPIDKVHVLGTPEEVEVFKNNLR